MSLVAFSSRARNARSASRVGVGSALCTALNVTSTRFKSAFSFRARTWSSIGYRSMRRRMSSTFDFAVGSARTTTTPWDGMPYNTAAESGARARQTRVRRSSSPRTSTRTRSFDLKASPSALHASGMIVAAGFVTRSTFEPIRCNASRSSGSSWRFVLKSTTQMSGVRPRATRSSVQKSPTVTTGEARPIVGKMSGPWTSGPIGHRRKSRSDSGSRNVTFANSSNAESELPVDMDAHLLRDLGARVVDDDHVALPVARRLAAAQRALVLIGHVSAVLARLRNLDDHRSAPLLPHAAFRPRPVLLDPVELAQGRLAHRQADLRLARGALVQGDCDDPRADLVPDPQVAFRVLPDEPLALLVDVHAVVHDLRDVQQPVERPEPDEGAELQDLDDGALDDLLQRRGEDEGVIPNPLIHRAVSVDDAALANPLDVARDEGEGLVGADLPFQCRARQLPRDRVDVLAEAFGRNPDGVLPLDPLIHENRKVARRVLVFRS